MTYSANQLYSEAAGKGSALRCMCRHGMPKTFAAGTALLAALTPVQFNTTTSFWEPWSGLSGQKIVSIAYGGATGGTYTLTIGGETTSALNHNASNATILAAISALGNVNAGDVAVGGGAAPGTAVTLTFSGEFKGKNPVVSITDSSTGGTGIVPTITQAAVIGGGEIKGFVWPDPVQLLAGNEVLGQVCLAGEIHYADIPLPAGEVQGTLDAALRNSDTRRLGFTIQGLSQVH